MTVLMLAGAIPAAAAAQLSADYRSLDTDHDQRLNRRELPPASLLKEDFARFDQNHDKFLDSKELAAAEQAMRWRTESHSHPFGHNLEHDGPPPTNPVGYINNNRGNNTAGQ